MVKIGNDWDERLAGEWDKPYYKELRSFLVNEYNEGTVYPPDKDIFNALRLTPYSEVKAVILGQDPYHEPGQAQGLSFSVPYGVPEPPSLMNILRELKDDCFGMTVDQEKAIGQSTAFSAEDNSVSGNQPQGILVPWAKQGVLLLNTVLTVRAHKAGSHRNKGWEQFTDRIIELLAEREKPMVFILWGANAGAKKELILNAQEKPGTGMEPGRRHLIIQAPHPSPLSAYRGFFGGRYFSRCNYFLEDNGIAPVDWRLKSR